MGLFDIFKAAVDPVSIVTDVVVETAGGMADIVDRFVHTPEEKAAVHLALKEHELKGRELAMRADAAILSDRQSARQMAGHHGKLQSAFALTFLVSFLLVLIGEIVFIGLIVRWSIGESAVPIEDWLQVLIASTLTGVLSYMASMLKEVVGFLFGGSAGGDDSTRALTETLRNAASPGGTE